MARTRAQAYGIKPQPYPEVYEPQFMTDMDPITKRILHWMAFDPLYGPESEAQIEWYTNRGYDTAAWEVGKPIKGVVKRPDPRRTQAAVAA